MNKKNTGKAPSIQLYYKDLVADMRGHGPEIFGAWMQILCQIWHENTNGKITKTLKQLSLIIQTSEAETQKLIDYISSQNIADITQYNGNITIINRRHKRECKLREQNRLRQEKYRNKDVIYECNIDVTEDLHPSSSSSSISSSIKRKSPPPNSYDESENPILMTTEEKQVFDAWVERNGVVGGSSRNVHQWKEAVAAYGSATCLKYISDIPNIHPGMIIAAISKDMADNRRLNKTGKNRDPTAADSDAAAKRQIEETRRMIAAAKRLKQA